MLWACPCGIRKGETTHDAATGPGFPLVLLAHALAGRGLWGTAAIPHAGCSSVIVF